MIQNIAFFSHAPINNAHRTSSDNFFHLPGGDQVWGEEDRQLPSRRRFPTHPWILCDVRTVCIGSAHLVSCFLINSYSDVPQVIYGVDFLGVREAMKNLTSRGAVDPLMKIELGLNESGMLVIHDAYAYGEVKEESIASRIKGFFGGSSSSTSTTATAEEGEETTIETAPSETPSESSATPEPTSSPASVPVKFELKHTSIVPYSSAQIMAARKRLIAVDNAEKLRNKKEEARNMLEGYSYRMRDLLVGEPTSPFILYSKEEERRKLEERMGEAFALVNEGDDAELAELWRRREEME